MVSSHSITSFHRWHLSIARRYRESASRCHLGRAILKVAFFKTFREYTVWFKGFLGLRAVYGLERIQFCQVVIHPRGHPQIASYNFQNLYFPALEIPLDSLGGIAKMTNEIPRPPKGSEFCRREFRVFRKRLELTAPDAFGVYGSYYSDNFNPHYQFVTIPKTEKGSLCKRDNTGVQMNSAHFDSFTQQAHDRLSVDKIGTPKPLWYIQS